MHLSPSLCFRIQGSNFRIKRFFCNTPRRVTLLLSIPFTSLFLEVQRRREEWLRLLAIVGAGGHSSQPLRRVGTSGIWDKGIALIPTGGRVSPVGKYLP